MTGSTSGSKEFPATVLGDTTVERALKVVGEILDTGGEASLRLADVSHRSGVSVGSLYHHFGSREGLISAARERQFLESLPSQAHEEVAYLIAASSPAEFVDRFDEVLRASDNPERAAGRRRRLEMIGAAAGRPGHLEGIVAMQTSYLDEFEALTRTLEARGWLPEKVDVRAVALLLHSTSMGRVIREIDDDPVELEEWHHLVRTMVGRLVSDHEQPATQRRAS
jgi:AcrR family transcriptional regulator